MTVIGKSEWEEEEEENAIIVVLPRLSERRRCFGDCQCFAMPSWTNGAIMFTNMVKWAGKYLKLIPKCRPSLMALSITALSLCHYLCILSKDIFILIEVR